MTNDPDTIQIRGDEAVLFLFLQHAGQIDVDVDRIEVCPNGLAIPARLRHFTEEVH